MKNDNIYILEDRGLIYLNGEDVKEYLQNLITNDIEKVTNKMSCFAALLTPQGKYLFDFLIIKHKSGYFLDCEKKYIDQLYNKLLLYKLRSKVEILNLSNEFIVAALSIEKFLSLDSSSNLEGYTSKYNEDTIFIDPRLKKLGARLIVNLEKLNLSLKKLKLNKGNVEDYYEFSHKLGISQIDNINLQNMPKALSVESWISRIYSINRGVISPRYVLTEAALQKYRVQNTSMLIDLMSQPEAAGMIQKIMTDGLAKSPYVDVRLRKFFQTQTVNAILANEILSEDGELNFNNAGSLIGKDSTVGKAIRFPFSTPGDVEQRL